MKEFKDLSGQEQADLVKKMVDIIEAAGFKDRVKADIMGEYVGILGQGKTEINAGLTISGTLKKTQEAEKNELVSKLREVAGDMNFECRIDCKVGVGDNMGVIDGADKICIGGEFVDGSASITHNAGEVILLDLWATWCPPCQEPMKHNNEMLLKGKDAWAGKVRIIGLSIDQDVGKLKSHIKDKNWTKVEHYHVSNGTCQASATYGSGGVPHVLLVDTQGTITFAGHPASIPLEEEIDALVGGKVYGGAAAEGEGAEGAGATGKITGEVATGLIAKWQANVDTLTADADFVKNASQLQRAFLVLVTKGSYDSASSSIVYEVQCHCLGMGPNEAAKEKIKTGTADFLAECESTGVKCQTMIR